jgi:hypothetical protein
LEKIMKVVIRKMGNSQGVIIPKPVLAQAGLVSECQPARNFDHLSAANSDQGLMVFSCGA